MEGFEAKVLNCILKLQHFKTIIKGSGLFMEKWLLSGLAVLGEEQGKINFKIFLTLNSKSILMLHNLAEKRNFG